MARLRIGKAHRHVDEAEPALQLRTYLRRCRWRSTRLLNREVDIETFCDGEFSELLKWDRHTGLGRRTGIVDELRGDKYMIIARQMPVTGIGRRG
ncbi:hypothetical protein CYG48_18490 (plasmid) [Neorhizobium sp. SOG26]|nr:hypothetical protein CYG48_18490 [Neorhizobium sp. SOG26]